MKESTSLVTNTVQCTHRRRGGPCYASWPGRAHPECREAALVADTKADVETIAANAAATSAARKQERSDRTAKRIVDGGVRLGK